MLQAELANAHPAVERTPHRQLMLVFGRLSKPAGSVGMLTL